ncbi:MAG TPA: DMT family transporter [Terriglobales bacterium]|nr:DMT family transporter [Terriglobales bacterium]
MPQLALLLTTVIWAATFPATKVALQEVPPIAFLFLRFLVSTVTIGVVLILLKQPLRRDRRSLVLAGIASIFLILGYVTQTVGLRYTTASNSAFITALYVVFVPLFLGRFSLQLCIALGLALLGLWLLVHPSTAMSIGDVLTFACAVAFALHIISLEFFVVKTTFQSLATWQLVMVTVALIPMALVETTPLPVFALTSTVMGALAITGILATGLAFFIQVWAQRHVPAQRVALIFALEPALSAWMSWLVLGERLDATGWAGSALILAGVLIGTRSKTAPHDPLQP